MRKTLAMLLTLGLALPLTARAAEPEPPLTETPPTTPADADTKLPIGPILLGSFGAVAVAVGAGFGWEAKQEFDDFNTKASSPALGPKVYPKATSDLSDKITAHAIVADVLMIGGVLTVAGSVLWWWFGDDKGKEKVDAKTAKLRPIVGPNAAGVSVSF